MKKAVRIVLILTSLVLVAVAIISATFLMTFVNSEEYVQLNLDNLNHAKINLSVFASNGEPFEEPFSIGKSKQIDFDRIPQHTKNAFVAVEDKRFYSHKGIDWIRVGGAVLSNVKSMSFSEGASTITQQLIKNTHLNHNKTMKRKFNEMLLASQLEKEFTKDQILENYLNTIYFGNGAVGIENASNTYFGKSAYDLTLEESATLAGIIKAPTSYSPKNNVEKCTKRRNLVLDLMEQNGYINQKDCQKAKNTPIVLCQIKKISYENDYLEEVIKEAMEVLGVDEKQLYNSNFSIYTYFDKDIQRNLTDTIASCSYDTNSLIIKNKNIVALNKAGNFHQKRQAGSALKPLAVYTPSLNEKLINVVSSVMDERVNFNGYSPKNANDKYVGWTTIENSVANSINTTAVKLLNSLTVAKSCQYLNKLGIETADENLSLALGNANKGLNVVDLGAGYSTLANNGQYQKPKTIEKIEKDGFTVYRNKEKEVKVFNDSSAFLMTQMLLEVSKNGTAKQLATLPFEVATKTGTVGTKSGNTDAIVAGYTTDLTFCFWCTTNEPDNIYGGQQPTNLAKIFLEKHYQANIPKNFEQPQSVVNISLDESALNEQKYIEKIDGKRVYFAKDNLPKFEKSTTKIAPKLTLENDKIIVESDQDVVYKKSKNGIEKLQLTLGRYVDFEIEKGEEYCYFIKVNDEVLESKITIEKDDDFWNFIKKWF